MTYRSQQSDRDEQKRRQELEDLRQFEQRRIHYARCYDNPNGHFVLREMIQESGIFQGGLKDKKELYFDEGVKNSLLKVAFHIPLVFGTAVFEWCQEQDKILEDLKIQRLRELENKE